MSNTKEKYATLVNFWNQAFKLDEEQINELKTIDKEAWKEFAPSQKLFNAAKSLSPCNNILDYGCGNGWASIIIAKHTKASITSVDVANNAIEALKIYKELFCINNINAYKVDDKWLDNEDDNKYDAIFCSNVLDILPLDLSLQVLANLARIAKKGAKVIISLNFYLDKDKAKERNLDLNSDNELYVNGVLRLLSKSDEEWCNYLSKYFIIEKLEYFAWPKEEKETRRLFYLTKK